MSEVKHTPGPWVIIPATPYDGDDDDLQGAYTSPAGIEGSNGDPVCVFGIAEGSGILFENEADYHLIAAAPELLEALRLGAAALLTVVGDEAVKQTTVLNAWAQCVEAEAIARAALAKAEGTS